MVKTRIIDRKKNLLSQKSNKKNHLTFDELTQSHGKK